MSIFDRLRHLMDDSDPDQPEKANEKAEENNKEITGKTANENADECGAESGEEKAEVKEEESTEESSAENSEENGEETSTGIDGFDLGQSSWFERITAEVVLSTLRPEHRLRASKDKPLLLGEFLGTAYDSSRENIGNAYVVIVDDVAGKIVRQLDSPADYDLMSDVVEFVDGKCRRRTKARNIILNVEIVNSSISRMIINMSDFGWSETNPWMLMTLSVMCVYRDGPSVYDVKYFMFEETVNKGTIERIVQIRESAIEKLKVQEPMTPEEEAAMGLRNFYRDDRYIDMMFAENSYGNAIWMLEGWFKHLREEFDKDVDNVVLRHKLRYFAFNLAECYLRIGLYDKALYYGEYAYDLCPDKNEIKEADFLITLMHAAKDLRGLSFRDHGVLCKNSMQQMVSSFDNTHKFGTIMKTCFDIFPSELNQMLLVKDNDISRVETVTSQREIWSLDFINKMADCEQMTAYISYRSIYGIIDDEYIVDRDPENDWNYVRINTVPMGTPDCSMERTNNVVVVNFRKVVLEDRRCVGMEVMVPGFVQQDNGRGLKGNFFLYAESDYLDLPLFEELRKTAETKRSNGEELTEVESIAGGYNYWVCFHFLLGKDAFENGRYGDALYHFSFSYQKNILKNFDIFALENGRDEKLNILVEPMAYYLETIFQNMGMHELAISYANRVAPETSPNHLMQKACTLTEATDFRGLKFFEQYRGKVKEIFPNLPEEEAKNMEKVLDLMYAKLLDKMDLTDDDLGDLVPEGWVWKAN